MARKTGRKLYLNKDVLTAARERLVMVFNDFDNIICSISGGKDSVVMVHLALEEARKRNRMIHLFWLDQEAEYQATVDTVRYYMQQKNVIPHWFQVPVYMTNSTSYTDEMLYAWGKGERWIRDKDPLAIHELKEEYPKRFYGFINWFEHQWNPRNTCFLVGLRAEESLNRFRTVIKNPGYKDWNWSTKDKYSLKIYPIYDWTFEDVWIYIARFNVRYNKIYDFLYAKGFDIKEMRVSNLIHEKAFKCLASLPEFEPDTYNKLIERIGGIHVAARYAKENMIYSANERPERFTTWKEYRDFLLGTSPLKHRGRLMKRFSSQPESERTYKGQCVQILINDWENNVPVATKTQVEKLEQKKRETIEKWRRLL